MAGQYRFKDQSGNIVAQISASVDGAIAFSGSIVDFTQANNVILGNVQLAGTASNALLLDGFDSQAFAFTSSIHPFTASIAGTNTFTSSATARLNSIETISASNVSRLNSIETITSSNIARLNSIETITSSNVARLNALEIKTGSLATTGSNTFIGTQTITGSLFISANLVVQGTSSLENITASAVSIGTNIVNLNTANPAIRYAGLVIGDSGSVGGSGSFLYDSVQDEMIFVHRGANTTVTSSVLLMGPQTYDNIGNEIYPMSNRIQKGTGNEHLADSCIIDDGTTVCVNTTLKASGQVCGIMSTFSCAGIATTSLSSTYGTLTIAGTGVSIADDGNAKLQIGRYSSTACNAYIKMGTNACSLRITNNTDLADLVVIDKGGNVGFNTSSPLTTLTVKSTNDNGYGLTRPSNDTTYHWRLSTTETGGDAYTVRYNTFNNDMLFTSYQAGGTGGNIIFRTTMSGGSGGETERFRINCHGIGVFSCEVCARQFRGNSFAVSPSGVFRGGLYTCNQISGTGTDCSLTLFSEGGANGGNFYITTGGSADVKFAMDGNGVSCFRCRVSASGLTTNANLTWNSGDGTDWYIRGQANGPAIRMKYHGGSTNRSAGLGWVDNNSNYYETLCWQDTSMFAFGILCSNSTICGANFSTSGFLRVHNTMKTFAISKNFGERQTNADYFRISSSSQGFQVMVYSIAQNVGVGWTQSQLFQASSAPYWGGWIGSSQAISTTGSGAGFISSVVNGNDGTLTFRVTTGDNGTNTTGTILSYIQVTAFSIDSITLTAL